MNKSLLWFAGFFAFLIIPFKSSLLFAYPEYSAFSGNNCMACHVGPIGGFGRKPQSEKDVGYITEKFSMSGDFQFMTLYDQRPTKSRVVMFPMEGSLNFRFAPSPKITMAASQDFGILREAYAMLHNENQSMYVRAGYITLPYGLLVADHTSFIKEGRIQSGLNSFQEVGLGAGLFGVRYKDSGIEAGLSGKPWFLNLAVTSGVVGQEDRAVPASQSGTKKALTRRAGYMNKNFCLGASMYTNDNEALDRRILRYGAFGWLHMGPTALIFEHDEGEDEQFTVSGSTQSSASYVEYVVAFPFPGKPWPSYAKLRYERLDPNRSFNGNALQRWVISYRFQPMDYLSIESFIEKNLETPAQKNDDVFVLAHVFF